MKMREKKIRLNKKTKISMKKAIAFLVLALLVAGSTISALTFNGEAMTRPLRDADYPEAENSEPEEEAVVEEEPAEEETAEQEEPAPDAEPEEEEVLIEEQPEEEPTEEEEAESEETVEEEASEEEVLVDEQSEEEDVPAQEEAEEESSESEEIQEEESEAPEEESFVEPEEEESSKSLPAFQKGESGPHEPQLKEKTTTPPKYYTEATLLRAMETAGKTVEDEDLRDAMKENGIGRPSTRAAIIEKLYQRKYIVKERKTIKATAIGIDLIHTIISPLLKSAELTGRWEKKLREIERGDYTAQQFLDELKQMTVDVVRELKQNKAGLMCPICRKGTIIRGRTRYGCSRWQLGCNYAEPFEQ